MKLIKEKSKAAALHFILNLIIALLTYYLVFYIWYPSPWSTLLNIASIFTIFIIVDACLGPILTFIVYNKSKKNLVIDLSIIGIIQLSALAYGIYTFGIARPVYLVFSQSRFDTVLAMDVYKFNENTSSKKLDLNQQNPWSLPLNGISIVSAEHNVNPEQKDLLLSTSLAGKADVQNILDLHRPYESAHSTIRKNALDPNNIVIKTAEQAADFKRIQTKYIQNYLMMPLKVDFNIYTVILNKDNLTVIGIEKGDFY